MSNPQASTTVSQPAALRVQSMVIQVIKHRSRRIQQQTTSPTSASPKQLSRSIPSDAAINVPPPAGAESPRPASARASDQSHHGHHHHHHHRPSPPGHLRHRQGRHHQASRLHHGPAGREAQQPDAVLHAAALQAEPEHVSRLVPGCPPTVPTAPVNDVHPLPTHQITPPCPVYTVPYIRWAELTSD